MGLLAKWNSLPVKARYYIGGSTFVFALVGDYVSTRIFEEVQRRKEMTEKTERSPESLEKK